MTVTRRYFEALIEQLEKLTPLDQSQFREYLQIKEELYSLINCVLKFDLFPLTFTPECIALLHSEETRSFTAEKLSIVNELHYELQECLQTRRLRYGGEFIKYSLRLEIALLTLPHNDLTILEQSMKWPENFLVKPYNFVLESHQKARIRSKRKDYSAQILFPDKTTVNKADHHKVEEKLQKVISDYETYVVKHYPRIATQFPFFHNKVRGYFTQAMAKDKYEFRIHAYQASDGDHSTKVHPMYYDFYGAYFHNLEEFTDKQVSALVVGLDKKSLSLESVLDKSYIHYELINIFIRNAHIPDMVNFIAFLLKCDDYLVDFHPSINSNWDITAERNGEHFGFEIFHTQLRPLNSFHDRIKILKQQVNVLKPVFVFTSYPGKEIVQLLANNSVQYISLSDLYSKHFMLQNSDILHWYILSRLPDLSPTTASSSITFEGEQLIKSLEKCIPGENEWSAYEKIGARVFEFLFADNFKSYLADTQSTNESNNHRRDLIVNNNYKDATSFWAEIKATYSSQAIIVDFKNYKAPLKSSDFFSVSKYAKRGVGNFAIVFSRRGIDDTAKSEQKTLYANGKLLIEFSDVELIQMIHEKMIGKNPIDRLDSKKFQLIKSL